jgi:hypothetical protein
MPRSWLSENQALDHDFASEDELTTASGVLRDYTTTVSGFLWSEHLAHISIAEIHFPWVDVYDLVTTTSGYLHNHIKGRYVSDMAPADTQAMIWSEFNQEWYPYNVADGFGVGYYHFSSHEAEASTNSETSQYFMSLTASGVEPGVYRLGWYYEYRLNKAGKILYVQISLDDNFVDFLHNVSLSMIQTTNYESRSGFYEVTFSGIADHHIDIYWNIDTATGGTMAYLRRVRLEFWRVN